MRSYHVCLSLFDFLQLAQCSQGLFMSSQMAICHFLWRNNIPLCLSIYHNFSVLPFLSEHLSCFQILAFISNAAAIWGMHISFKISVYVFFKKCPDVEFLNLMIFLNFWRTSAVFPCCVLQFTFPTTVHKGFLFSISFPTLAISCLFNDSHSNKCAVVSHCGCDLQFNYLLGHLYIFIWKISIQIFFQLFNQIVFFFLFVKNFLFFMYFTY